MFSVKLQTKEVPCGHIVYAFGEGAPPGLLSCSSFLFLFFANCLLPTANYLFLAYCLLPAARNKRNSQVSPRLALYFLSGCS
jgi:hypothetical protein